MRVAGKLMGWVEIMWIGCGKHGLFPVGGIDRYGVVSKKKWKM